VSPRANSEPVIQVAPPAAVERTATDRCVTGAAVYFGAMNHPARLAVVEQHVRAENLHDLDAVMTTFGADARYDDEPWGDHRQGRDGVQSYYSELMHALPDLVVDVTRRHVSSDGIVLEVNIRGTHRGAWRGLPATGRRVDFPLCGVFTFDAEDRLAGERIYYDRATVLRQLGVFREPSTWLGRMVTALAHPVTIVRAYARGARVPARTAVPPPPGSTPT
jgi:steroid delta-isomerase-like uncharacterized protein